MSNFTENNLPSKIDTGFLNVLEVSNRIDNLDDLLEAYLWQILHMDQVRQSEILLFSTNNILLQVAESKWSGSHHKSEPKVYSESWVLDYAVRHTTKRTGTIQIRSAFSIPLMDSGTIMGFLNIQLEKLYLIEKNQLRKFYLMGLQLSANIKEIRLKSKIKLIREELQLQISNNNSLLHQATSLSKELYAISAISTKINQSMDFDKTLHRCLSTIRKVYEASTILIYTKIGTNKKIELVAVECGKDRTKEPPCEKFLKSIEKNLLKETLQSEKPLVKERLMEFLPELKGAVVEPYFASLIGAPLNSRQATIGSMMLLYESAKPINSSGLRLLSGIANIMGMAIENIDLYRQSIQKKNEIDFLFRSIVKFNKTLDLNAILKSVAEKVLEYCGLNSRVYLFSKTRGQLILSHYKKKKRNYAISSSLFEKIEPRELKRVYLKLAVLIREKSTLIRSIPHCRKIGPSVKPAFSELNICSLVAVPLMVGQKKLGMLLLVRGSDATPFGLHDQRFAEALAGTASLAIENGRAFTASQEMSDFLEEKISQKNYQLDQIQSRQRVRVENRKDIIFQVNLHNRFVFANKAMEVLSGLPREILCHKDFNADGVVAAEERTYIRGLFRKILTKEVSLVKGAEYRHVSHKGDDHIISLTIFPEYDQHGNVVGVEGVGRDITEKKKLETELEKAKELALLGEFSSAVAHQIRNPLGNILMGTKRLESALGLGGAKWGGIKDSDTNTEVTEADRTQIADITKDLSQGVYNLNQVVTELLEYTKTLKLSPSSQRIETIMRETVQMYTSLLDQNRILVVENFQDSLPRISVDAVLIGQVFQNVVYNAIQAMPRGGELNLFATISGENPDLMLLGIKDSGLGISPSDMDRVFRPFYTTKTLGTGLGLSVAHRIVEAHGGVIEVYRNPSPSLFSNKEQPTGYQDNKQKSGTTVHIILPTVAGNNNQIMKND